MPFFFFLKETIQFRKKQNEPTSNKPTRPQSLKHPLNSYL